MSGVDIAIADAPSRSWSVLSDVQFIVAQGLTQCEVNIPMPCFICTTAVSRSMEIDVWGPSQCLSSSTMLRPYYLQKGCAGIMIPPVPLYLSDDSVQNISASSISPILLRSWPDPRTEMSPSGSRMECFSLVVVLHRTQARWGRGPLGRLLPLTRKRQAKGNAYQSFPVQILIVASSGTRTTGVRGISQPFQLRPGFRLLPHVT